MSTSSDALRRGLLAARSAIAPTAVVVLAAAGAACGGNAGEATSAPGGPPAMGVKVVTLAQKPLAETSEYIATLRSLRSTTIQPQVDGFVTRVFVRSGARVAPGQPLVQIDADKEQAALRSLESRRAAIAAELGFAKQQAERAEALVKEGAISRQDADQARTTYETTQAQVAALDEQIREQRVQLRYFQVTAPVAGIVGDIPVRVGDRVTSSTVITTIDQSTGRDLEAHVAVPLERAPNLRVGLPLELLDGTGTVVGRNRITFVAPRVDESMQTVLAKSLLRDVPPSLRVEQYVRARIVWQTAQGLSIPVVAVTRISGQHFCFVAETQGNGFVARQRPVRVGEIIGDDYVVVGGLKPGDRLIVSGIQKLGDGVPVRPEA